MSKADERLSLKQEILAEHYPENIEMLTIATAQENLLEAYALLELVKEKLERADFNEGDYGQ